MTGIESLAAAGADLRLVDVHKRFPGFTAIESLDFRVPAGSFFALLGPSGCGKTTTLRMIAGLEEPTRGRILIGGQDVTDVKPYRRPVNTVFQSYALFPHLTVLENVAFGLRRRRIPDPGVRAHQALQLVELDDLAARRPAQLSGGQQQRVALARAIVGRPSILLLDEPLGALDLQLRRQMQGELKRIQAEVGLTFLHVTHDQEEAMTMADTVAVMNHGRIEQLGSPQDLYDRPATPFVANFLGRSNLFTGDVVGEHAGTVVIDVAGQRLSVAVARTSERSGRLSIGVRPEKVRLHTTMPARTAGVERLGPGRVVDVSFSGVSTQYTVEVPGTGEIEVFEQNSGAGPAVAPGAEVWVSWHTEHAFGLAARSDAHDEGTIALELSGNAPAVRQAPLA